MNRPEILDAAKKAVCGDRDVTHGSPENSFALIAALWTDYSNALIAKRGKLKFTASDVAVLMALFKCARIGTGVFHPDNWVDLAGYAACGGEIQACEPIVD